MSSESARPGVCPYPGLRPFTSKEAEYFFGRGEQVEQMLAKLEEHCCTAAS